MLYCIFFFYSRLVYSRDISCYNPPINFPRVLIGRNTSRGTKSGAVRTDKIGSLRKHDGNVSLKRRFNRPGQGFWVYGILGVFNQGIRYFFFLPKYRYKLFCFPEFLVFCI